MLFEITLAILLSIYFLIVGTLRHYFTKPNKALSGRMREILFDRTPASQLFKRHRLRSRLPAPRRALGGNYREAMKPSPEEEIQELKERIEALEQHAREPVFRKDNHIRVATEDTETVLTSNLDTIRHIKHILPRPNER